MVDNREVAVSIHNLRMGYGSDEVLKGISIEIPKGQFVGFVGPNGAGKSTIIKIMLGIVGGYSGTIKIFGKDISDGNVEYKKNIGYVPQTVDMYDSLTPFEYLTFLGEVYGMKMDTVNNKAKKLMDLFEMADEYHSRISSFSKGMKQKILFIASLIHNPDLIFLDEPFSGLDANSVKVVEEILRRLSSSGKTIFYSSHLIESVEKISDRIILLDKGQILADGSFKELMTKCSEGSFKEIFNQLTGFNSQREIADEFINILNEV